MSILIGLTSSLGDVVTWLAFLIAIARVFAVRSDVTKCSKFLDRWQFSTACFDDVDEEWRQHDLSQKRVAAGGASKRGKLANKPSG